MMVEVFEQQELKMLEGKNYLVDMDGVLISGNTLIPGADQFIQRLRARKTKFLLLTNNSRHTPRDLAFNLQQIGLNIDSESIFNSAMATARFLHTQRPGGTAFVIGESGLTSALHEIGYIFTEHHPDYFVLGETLNYNFDQISRAVRLVKDGARFIATNPDASGPTESGIVPACGAMAALIQTATGIAPFFVGKPNPLMMRSALNYLGVHSEDTFIIGDRMDTDIIAGVETGLGSILVLSGVTKLEDIQKFPYKPSYVVRSVDAIDP
jgi:NagD protein